MMWLKWSAVVTLALVVSGCIAVPVADHRLYSQRAFESDLWKPGDVRQRARMVVDLKRGGDLIGLDRAEVLDRLGPPDRDSPPWRMEYDYVHGSVLGDFLDLPFSNWHEWVIIDFDVATGRVKEVDLRD